VIVTEKFLKQIKKVNNYVVVVGGGGQSKCSVAFL